jgi:hypothetical protein
MEACDVECQRQKKLQALQYEYMKASSKAGIDPVGFEQAKIAYFSLKDGPTWLHNYKQQKAEQEAEQTIRNLKTINDAQQYHSDQQPFEEEDYSFVQKYLEQKKDENDVEWRLFSFSMNSNPWYYWLELGLTIILSLFIVYQLYMKYPKLLKYFTIES